MRQPLSFLWRRAAPGRPSGGHQLRNVGATAGRPYMPDSGRNCGETKPKPKPSASGFGLERRSKGAARMAATRPPERKRTLRRRARQRATAGRPYMPDSGRSCGETKPKPKPSASGFGLERRSKEAARMAAARPPERKRTLRRRARRRATAGRPCVPNSGDS